MFTLIHHWPHRPPPRLRHHRDFAREVCQAENYGWDMQLGACVAVDGVVFGFVVDADPGEYFIRGLGVLVCPVMQIFVYPD